MAKCPDCRVKETELLTTWERIRNWLVWRLFPEDMRDERNGFFTAGFGEGQKAGYELGRLSMQTTVEALREEIKDLQTKPIIHTPLHPPDEHSILTVEKNSLGQNAIHIGGIELSPALASEMQIQATRIAASKVWKVFQESFRQSAYLTMFEKSQSFADMQAGKGMLKALEIFKNFVDTFKNYQPPKQPTIPKSKP